MSKKLEVRKILLILGDFFCFELAIWVGLSLRRLNIIGWQEFIKHAPFFSLLFLIWLVVNYINQLYDIDQNPDNIAFYRKIWEAAGISLLAGIVFFYLTPIGGITPKTILVLTVISGYSLITIWRWISFTVLLPQVPPKRIAFVGKTDEVRELKQILQNKHTNTYQVDLLVKDAKNIAKKVKNKNIDIVVIAPRLKENKQDQEELFQLLFQDIELRDLISFYEEITGRVPPSTFQESWFLDNLGQKNEDFSTKLRRLLDIVVGLILSITTLVLSPLIILAIKLNSEGPAFINQKRVGQDECEFTMYKFRSMYALTEDGMAEKDGPEFAQKDDDRITTVGKFLRKTRLDELPQSWNLLKGDLTLIGPRPERPEIVKQIKQGLPYYELRHVVKPGLTSWALLHQNYTDTLEETIQKLQYDLYYIKNRSFLLDLSIGLRTVNVLIKMMGQ